jgi:hypothetical protein
VNWKDWLTLIICFGVFVIVNIFYDKWKRRK